MSENYIPANELCEKYDIEISFIYTLRDKGLIELTTINQTGCISGGQLQDLEKMVRLYYDLDINIEGIETILHLLKRITGLQDEIIRLRNRLRVYEDEL